MAWRPDGSELLIARYNRVMSQVEIQAVNAHTGSVRTVLTETSVTFIAHHHEVLWGNETGFTLLPDGSGFIWNSERSGWDHLYHYDMEGRLIRQLTDGSWRVKEVIRVDLASGCVYFTGHGDEHRPYDTHLYRVGLDGNGLAQLTQGKGQHVIALSPSGKYFTDTYSAVDIPPSTVLRAVDGTLLRTLEEADVSALHAIGWIPSSEYVVKAADGVTDLWATVHFPYNWNPKEKYPVVEYIYGGPQSLVRPLDFGDQPKQPAFTLEENFNRALAQLGFVVVTLDGRGTPGRSKAFQDTVYKKFGQFEIADHAAALRELGERLPCLDLDRVGVWGWSWGGQFAFRCLTQAPALYKVGVCGWPALDLQRMMLYEAYLGMPQENTALYRAADPFALAPKLQGKLLLVGGMNDPSTQADLFKMSECLIRLGKQHLAMSYPNCGHGAVGKTAEYNVELKKRFFLEHLMTWTTGGSESPASPVEIKVDPCTL
jgi:dipeptidyl aminopeptidase/acylaminoacyl peptidase